jgi:predicted nuclease of predicted toxin-antitoxin system
LSKRRVKLLLDENIGLRVYEELKRRGYEVQTVIEELCGASDEEVLRIALDRDKIVVTMDKDFGYLA